MRIAIPALLLVALVSILPRGLAAQEAAAVGATLLRVHVVDQATRKPLPSAAVEFRELGLRRITNASGHAVFVDVPAGTHTVQVRIVGFEDFETEWRIERNDAVNVTVALGPRPIVLPGVSARGYQFGHLLERRRRSAATSTRVIGRTLLANTGSRDARQFVASYGGLTQTSCPGGGFGQCVVIRGRAGRPSVVIDERPAYGGLDELALYHPQELYAVEIFGGGRQIRAYTLDFVERSAQRPNQVLFPLLFF